MPRGNCISDRRGGKGDAQVSCMACRQRRWARGMPLCGPDAVCGMWLLQHRYPVMR